MKKKVDNTKLSFFERLIPYYKQMWKIGSDQGWCCIDCQVDISHDPEWVCHLGQRIATCEKCGIRRWGKLTDGFGNQC